MDEANAQEKANAAKAIKDECEGDLAEVSGRRAHHACRHPPAVQMLCSPSFCRLNLNSEDAP